MAPQIIEFNAGDLGLRPQETGIEATARGAVRLNTAYNEAAELQKETGKEFGTDITVAGQVVTDWKSHQEISQGAATFSAIQLAKDKEWEAIASSNAINTPGTPQAFMQGSVQPVLEQWRSGFLTDKGQAWADRHIEAYQDHLLKKTAADQSHAAGSKIKSDLGNALNDQQNRAYLAGDEKTVLDAMDTFTRGSGGVIGSSPVLQGKAGLKQGVDEDAKKGIINAGVSGAIYKSGEIPDWARKPEYSKYLDYAELDKKADARKKHLLEENRVADAYKEKQTADKGSAEIYKTINNRLTHDDAGNSIIDPKVFRELDDVANTQDAENNRDYKNNKEVQRLYEEKLNWLHSQMREKKEADVSDPATKADLFGRMLATENATTDVEIDRANANPDPKKHISSQDHTKLMQYYNALQKTPLKDPRMADAIKESLGGKVMDDSEGRFNDAMDKVLAEYLKLSQQGKAPSGAGLSTRDPNSWISKEIQQFKPTQQELSAARTNNFWRRRGFGDEETPVVPANTEALQNALSAKQWTAKQVEDLKKEHPDAKIDSNGKYYVILNGRKVILTP